jgi:hypothetical protein
VKGKKQRGMVRAFTRQFDLISGQCLLDKINLLQQQMQLLNTEPLELKLTHHFAPSTYGREILLPADSLVIGKTHRHAHLNIISKGMVTVVTEHGIELLTAPCSFISTVGVKRAVYAHQDTVWTCIHPNPTNTTDLAAIEADVIVSDQDVLAFRAALGLDVLVAIQGEQ